AGGRGGTRRSAGAGRGAGRAGFSSRPGRPRRLAAGVRASRAGYPPGPVPYDLLARAFLPTTAPRRISGVGVANGEPGYAVSLPDRGTFVNGLCVRATRSFAVARLMLPPVHARSGRRLLRASVRYAEVDWGEAAGRAHRLVTHQVPYAPGQSRPGSLAQTHPLFDEGGTDGSSGGPLRLRAKDTAPERLNTRGEVGVLDLRAGLDPVLAREAAPPGGVQSPTHTTLTAPPQTNGSGVPRRLCDRLPAGRGRRRRD